MFTDPDLGQALSRCLALHHKGLAACEVLHSQGLGGTAQVKGLQGEDSPQTLGL